MKIMKNMLKVCLGLLLTGTMMFILIGSETIKDTDENSTYNVKGKYGYLERQGRLPLNLSTIVHIRLLKAWPQW